LRVLLGMRNKKRNERVVSVLEEIM
jgi:hypothetical protein